MRTLYRAGAVHSPADSFATALVVDDGAVAWLGSQEAVRAVAGDVDDVVDLGDDTLITPAFVDAHVHVTETGLVLGGLDLTGARSVTQILDAVARAGAGGRAVLGHGWDETALAEGRPPTRAELDRAAPGSAVYLSRVDVHSAVVSSELADRSGAGGRPGWSDDGRVERDAHHAARDATRSALTGADRRAAQLAALRAAAARGIVAVHEMSAPHIGTDDDLRELVALAADPALALPEVVAYRGELVATSDEAKAVADRIGVELAGLAGDLCVDGSFGSRTAALADDYADAPGSRGHLYLDVEAVRDHVAACTRAGLQAGFHVIGDEAVRTALRGIRRAAEQVGIAAVRAARHRLEHVEAVDADGVADLADLGVTASVQPAFDALWGGEAGLYATRLGEQRARALNPFAALAAAGVPLALGSDSPVTPLDPWAAVRAATFHQVGEQRISARAAFSAHTRGAWRASRVDDAGVLTLGAPASFAVWAVGDLVVQAPDDRIQAWSTDPRSGTPGLPDLTPGRPLPQCRLTVARGRVLHDAR